ncbi:MAG TPA: hypothetical protein VIY69_13010 [Candidatus Acidoferrales bacterium]
MAQVTLIIAKDISKLLADVPKGDWVVLSNDQERMLGHGPDLEPLMQTAKASGEDLPFVTRVPDIESPILIL